MCIARVLYTISLSKMVDFCSAQFVPAMINSLSRLGLPGNTTLDNRFLAVDMASTLLYWDTLAARQLDGNVPEVLR